MAGFRAERMQDVLARAMAMRKQPGNPGPSVMPTGAVLSRQEQEMLRKVAQRMMRRRGGVGALFGQRVL